MSKQPSNRAYGLARGCLRNERDIINLALAIDSVISTAREEAYMQCIALARNSGYHALVAEIRALAAQEAKDALASKGKP